MQAKTLSAGLEYIICCIGAGTTMEGGSRVTSQGTDGTGAGQRAKRFAGEMMVNMGEAKACKSSKSSWLERVCYQY